MSQLFASGGQVLEFRLQHQSFQWTVLPMNTQDWCPWGWTCGSPCSPRDFQESSPTQQFKAINYLVLSFLYGLTLTSIHDYWKNHSSDNMAQSILDIQENKSWIFSGRTDDEAEAAILWPPDVKNWLEETSESDAGKDWRQEEKGTTEDEVIGWYHPLNEHEFEQAPGVGDGQGSLACCSPWGVKELDMTEWLNWIEHN